VEERTDSLTVSGLKRLLKERRISSVEIVQECLRRIEALNRRGPELGAVIEVSPGALQEAAELDARFQREEQTGILFGIPVLLKDSIGTTGPMMSAAGSLALADTPAVEDAYITRRLREAGAVILGKANMSEWANFRSTHSTSGWSSRGGQCRNPYDLTRSPCGSSSGSAVAVTAGLVPAAVGTETDGSIICPSAMNCTVGIKPTRGLVSRSGIVPISPSQDTAGPIAASVEDAALLLAALAGYDPQDPGSSPAADQFYLPDLASGDDSLRGLRIGVARNLCGFDPRTDALFEEHLKVFERCGALIVDSCEILQVHEYQEAEMTLLLYEFKDALNEYLRKRGNTSACSSLEQLISYNEEHARQVMPHFGQELFLMAQAKGDLKEPEYLRAKELCRQKSVEEGTARIFAEHELDLLAAPSNGPAWKIDYILGDRYTGGSSSLAAVSGWPSITIPAGFIAGLPIGTTLIGRPFCEPLVIRAAHAAEQAAPMRKAPVFR
jgi:amidase